MLAECTGDCDDDGAVSVAELVRCVNIALGTEVLQACVACRACIEVCPTSCLAQGPPGGSREAVRKPVLENPRGCIACGFCAVECPVEAVKMAAPETG